MARSENTTGVACHSVIALSTCVDSATPQKAPAAPDPKNCRTQYRIYQRCTRSAASGVALGIGTDVILEISALYNDPEFNHGSCSLATLCRPIWKPAKIVTLRGQ